MATAATAAITNWISALHLPLAQHECRARLKLVLGADDSRCEDFSLLIQQLQLAAIHNELAVERSGLVHLGILVDNLEGG